MKALDLIVLCCNNGVSLNHMQVVTINEEPLLECANFFGEFNSFVLPSPGTYLAEWVKADCMAVLTCHPDAILVLEDVMSNGIVHLYRIDD